jgi:hypothetical protein
MTDGLDRELALLGTWRGWGGEPTSWPVTDRGRAAVEWALETHREFYTDAWLTSMCVPGRHPLMSVGSWPLSASELAIVHLLERAARINVLAPESRARLAASLTRELAEFHHLDLLLETAGLAARHGWLVQPEVELATGRRPDLRLTRNGTSFSIEVTRMGIDRDWRAADRWFGALHVGLLDIEARYAVTASGGGGESAVITSVDVQRFLTGVEAAAADVARDGRARTVDSEEGLTVTVQPDSPQDRTLEGPALGGDAWPRIANRLRTKAERTAGGPPVWIRLDEQSGLFLFSDWAASPPETGLGQLRNNVQIALASYPHVRGVVVSHGTAWNPGLPALTVVGEPLHEALKVGPALLDRLLPGRRVRRTLVVPIEVSRIVLPDHLEAEPAAWYAAEDSWLDWALRRCGQPSLSAILKPRSTP